MYAVCREVEGGLARICNSLFLVVVILVLVEVSILVVISELLELWSGGAGAGRV